MAFLSDIPAPPPPDRDFRALSVIANQRRKKTPSSGASHQPPLKQLVFEHQTVQVKSTLVWGTRCKASGRKYSLFWRLQMDFKSGTVPFAHSWRWKCTVFTTYFFKSYQKLHILKKCGVSLSIISVVPLWLNILISCFCGLKIFHLIYNL